MSIFGKRIQTRVITIDDNGKVTDIKREPKPTRNKTRAKTGGGFSFFSFFKSSRSAYNDNGREYSSASGNWEYTAEANGNADPCQCNYEAPKDYQGSVPICLE